MYYMPTLEHLQEEKSPTKTVVLPDLKFDPKKEKTAKQIFKLISFEFAKSDVDVDGVPELGLTTFRVRHSSAKDNI